MKTGTRIKAIYFPIDNGRMESNQERQLEFLIEQHSPTDFMDWVISKQNGKEICRFNPRYLESIEWEDPQ